MTDSTNPVPDVLPLPQISSTTPKPGWQTTEFWMKIAAFVLTALFASGAIPTSGPVAQVAAIAATMLGALGYTVGRSLVKAAGGAVLALALLAGGTQTACGSTSKAAGTAVLSDVVDCTTADRVKLETQFGPTVEQALQRATGLDGKVDLPSLTEIGRSLEADGWCVLEKEVARLMAAALTRNPSSPAAAAAPLDAEDLAGKLAVMRVHKFGATQFQLGGSP
jgi:hypothetical protein